MEVDCVESESSGSGRWLPRASEHDYHARVCDCVCVLERDRHRDAGTETDRDTDRDREETERAEQGHDLRESERAGSQEWYGG